MAWPPAFSAPRADPKPGFQSPIQAVGRPGPFAWRSQFCQPSRALHPAGPRQSVLRLRRHQLGHDRLHGRDPTCWPGAAACPVWSVPAVVSPAGALLIRPALGGHGGLTTAAGHRSFRCPTGWRLFAMRRPEPASTVRSTGAGLQPPSPPSFRYGCGSPTTAIALLVEPQLGWMFSNQSRHRRGAAVTAICSATPLTGLVNNYFLLLADPWAAAVSGSARSAAPAAGPGALGLPLRLVIVLPTSPGW